MGHVIGCDVGSQSVKGVLVDAEGNTVTAAASPYDVAIPKAGWAEQDADSWLEGIRLVVGQLLDRSGVRPSAIGSIGLAAQADGVVAADSKGRPLRPAIIWMDRRAELQCVRLRDRIEPDRIFALTGLNLDSVHIAPKVLWLRDEEPHAFRAASTMHYPASFVVGHLTRERVGDHSNASSTMLYDVRRKEWSEEMFEAAELDPSLFPRLAPASEVAGELTSQAADALRLGTGTKVVVGCGDEHGACLGAGLVESGLVCDIVGTAEPIGTTSAEAVFDETGLVETHVHADPDFWLVEHPGFVSGGSMRWYANRVARTTYEEMELAASGVAPGSEGLVFLPCLSGAMTPRWNGKARGTFVGLSLRHGDGHLARAVFEGCAFAFRDIVDRLEALGLGEGEIRAVGGGAKSHLWCQIKADLTGRRIRTLASPEATATGAAMLASVADGNFASLQEAAGQMVRLGPIFEPQPTLKPVYDEAYALYRNTYMALEPLFDRFP